MLSAAADPRRRLAFAALALLALGLHALLLGGLEDRTSPPPATATMAVQVRTLTLAPVAEPSAPPPPSPSPPRRAAPSVDKPSPAAPRRATAVPAPAAVVAPLDEGRSRSEPEPEPDQEPVPPAPPPGAPESEGTVLALAASPAASAASAVPEPDGAPPPLYATRVPPPATLHYELRRGRLTGSGDLQWRTDAGRYQLRLQGSVLGLNVLTQVSEGALDESGLAPLRFTDQRARRAAVAANFEREAGRIRFSGPKTELPWHPGVQDRLSWMIQLAAVAAAEPQRLAAGEHIVLQVVGARGDASLWSFRSLGRETLTLFSDTVETVRLLREPRSPHDTRVEVWLDPARHHLPVRATMGSSDEDRIELQLRELLP